MKPYVKYSDEIAKEICLTIATSTVGVKKLCKANPHWPDACNINRWCYENEEFRNRYASAKEAQMTWLAEEALDVAYDDSRDILENHKGEMVMNHVKVNRDKLIVDTIKWTTAKLAPKVYGMNKIEVGAEESLLEKIVDKL